MQVDSSLLHTLKELGPWVISLIALAQVWVIAAWKRFGKRGIVEIHQSGNIELGYGSFGPTISLNGTLRALNKDLFIQQMRLIVIRKKDSARFGFNWRAFRPNTIPLSAQQPPSVELASSFLVSPSTPHKYNVFFVDETFIAEIKPKIVPLLKVWQDFAAKQLGLLAKPGDKPDYSLLQTPAFSEFLFESFTKTDAALAAYTAMNNNLYWKAGEHELTLMVETAKPNKQFPKKWRFILSEDDIDNLRKNVVVLIREACGLPVVYNFAYPEYQT